MGKESFAVFVKSDGPGPPIDVKDSSQVVAIFNWGKRDFGETFTRAVVSDFGAVGLHIDAIWPVINSPPV